MGRHFSRGKNNSSSETPSDGEAELEALRRLRGESSATHTSSASAGATGGADAHLPSTGSTAKSHRSWKRKLLVAFNCLLAVLLLAGVAGFGYVKWRFGQVSKIDLSKVLNNESDAGDPMTILLVGSDSRENLAPGESKSFGSASKVGGQRSDTIMLLHIDPKTKQAAILSLPRDLWVTIAGTKTKAKINSAFDGGADQLISTIKQNFDIPIDHYVEVDFDGFKGIVDSIGGVQVPFSAPARDWGFDEASGTNRNLSGLDIKQAGCIKLNGTQALSYVRSRHYQALEGGRWVSDPQSDITRIQRQQDFIRRVLRSAVSKGSSNPVTLNNLISNGVKNVQIDDSFGLGDMTKVARRFQPLDPAKVQMMTMPNKGSMVNGQSVLLVKQPDAQQTIDQFLGKTKSEDNTTANVPVETISVRVLNGSGISGAASQAASDLSEGGYVRGGIGDAKAISVTTIRYAPGTKAKAQTLKTWVGGDVNLVEDSTIKGVDVILTLGQGFTGISAPGSPPKTTSTTAPEATTTTTTASPFVPSDDPSC